MKAYTFRDPTHEYILEINRFGYFNMWKMGMLGHGAQTFVGYMGEMYSSMKPPKNKYERLIVEIVDMWWKSSFQKTMTPCQFVRKMVGK